MKLKLKAWWGHYDVVEAEVSDDMGFCLSSAIPELRIGITRSSISGKTSFFCVNNKEKS